VIERAVVLGTSLEELDLAAPAARPQTAAASGAPGASGTVAAESGRELNMRDALNRLERDLLLEAHRRSGGVRKEAARLLGIDPRNLGYYFHKHRIDPGA